MEHFFNAIKHDYANFRDRASRTQFFMFYLYLILFDIVWLIAINIFLGINEVLGLVFNGLFIIYSLALIIPILSIIVRRLHDSEHSAWCIFIQLIPIIGVFWFLFLLLKRGDDGYNRYGYDPSFPQHEEIDGSFG